LETARATRSSAPAGTIDDVRDSYLEMLFDVDPQQFALTTNHDRYLQLSRIVSGEVMAAAFCEWRRGRSSCTAH
jgi:beta-mannosidase